MREAFSGFLCFRSISILFHPKSTNIKWEGGNLPAKYCSLPAPLVPSIWNTFFKNSEVLKTKATTRILHSWYTPVAHSNTLGLQVLKVCDWEKVSFYISFSSSGHSPCWTSLALPVVLKFLGLLFAQRNPSSSGKHVHWCRGGGSVIVKKFSLKLHSSPYTASQAISVGPWMLRSSYPVLWGTGEDNMKQESISSAVLFGAIPRIVISICIP